MRKRYAAGIWGLGALVIGGCELVATVDRSRIDAPDGGGATGGTETGGTDGSGGDESTGGTAAAGASSGGASSGGTTGGGGMAEGGSTSLGGAGNELVNTCEGAGLGGAFGDFDAPEIAGEYVSGTPESNTFEVPERIGTEVWTTGTSEEHFFYASVDNASNSLVAQNAETNFFFGCTWSRFVWHTVGEDLYYCQDVFDAASAAEAADAPSNADTGDIEAGCLGASWYLLVSE